MNHCAYRVAEVIVADDAYPESRRRAYLNLVIQPSLFIVQHRSHGVLVKVFIAPASAH